MVMTKKLPGSDLIGYGIKSKVLAPRKKRAPKKETIGERGKNAEAEVTKVLEVWNGAYASFAYERLPDARAARGRLKAQIADFMVWNLPHNIPLEVKSTEHNYRIEKDKLDQLPRLKKVALAGAKCYVLVHFKTIDKWRVAPISYFEFGVPSWDMSNLKTFDTPKEALESTGFFPTS